ncbi:hypothetical protein [Rhizobium phaseoli]|uniref:hypothetical protein n=1 Tax=Rhizobium phaseoli TaxID=396 RepID=UPI00055AA797|nr:hypothetical protein [Rhizobium phaseoli]
MKQWTPSAALDFGGTQGSVLVAGYASAGVFAFSIGFNLDNCTLNPFSENFLVQLDYLLELAGLEVGFAQVMLADKVSTLERVPIDLVPPMPVWLVMHEEVRTSARIRRLAGFLGTAIAELQQEDRKSS